MELYQLHEEDIIWAYRYESDPQYRKNIVLPQKGVMRYKTFIPYAKNGIDFALSRRVDGHSRKYELTYEEALDACIAAANERENRVNYIIKTLEEELQSIEADKDMLEKLKKEAGE